MEPWELFQESEAVEKPPWELFEEPEPAPLITGPGQPIFTPKQVEAAPVEPKPVVETPTFEEEARPSAPAGTTEVKATPKEPWELFEEAEPVSTITGPGQPIFTPEQVEAAPKSEEPKQKGHFLFPLGAPIPLPTDISLKDMGKQLAGGVKDVAANMLKMAGVAARKQRIVSPRAAERGIKPGQAVTIGTPIFEPVPWDELTDEEIVAKLEPNWVEKAADVINKNKTIQKWQQDVGKKADIDFKKPLDVPYAVLHSAIQTGPLMVAQMGLTAAGGIGAGAGGMMLMEGGAFNHAGQQVIDRLKEAGADEKMIAEFQHNIEENSFIYGPLSGTVEFAGNSLGPLRGVLGAGKKAGQQFAKKATDPVMKTIMKEFGGFMGEGAEEWGQGGLMNIFMHKAIEETRKKYPDFAPEWQRNVLWKDFVTGALVSPLLRGGATAFKSSREQGQPTFEQEEADAGVTPEPTPTPLEEPGPQVQEAVEQEGALTAEEEISQEEQPVVEEVQPEVEVIPETEQPGHVDIQTDLKVKFQREGKSEEESQAEAEAVLSRTSPEDQKIFTELASQERRKAEVDILTGLKTKNWAERNNKLKDGVDEQGRPKRVLIDGHQIMIDLDNFGIPNKEHGQLAGDQVLQEFGLKLREKIGERADLIRIGGEEISVVPHSMSDKESILNDLEALREEFKKEEFVEGKWTNQSFSAGVGNTFEEADAQMNLAKKAGKDVIFMGGKQHGKIEPSPGKVLGAGKGSRVGPVSGKEPSKTEKPKVKPTKLIRDFAAEEETAAELKSRIDKAFREVKGKFGPNWINSLENFADETEATIPEIVSWIKKKAPDVYKKLTEKMKIPVAKPPPKKPVKKKPAELKVVGLNKPGQDRIREVISAVPLTSDEKKSHYESLSQAKAKGLDKDALAIARKVTHPKNKGVMSITDEEHAGMVLKAAELMNDFNEVTENISDLQDKGDTKGVRTETARRVQISEDLDVLTAGARSARRDVARALSIGKMMINMVKYDVASTTQQARTMKGRALTEKETKKFTDLSHAYANLEERFNKLTEENKVKQEEVDKRIAQEVANILAGKERKVKTKRFTKILDERANILKDLNKLGFRMKEISGLGIEGSYHVGRLATNYIREMAASIKGKIEMAEVVKKVQEKLPDVTDQDIYQALNQKNPKVQAKAKSAAEKQVTRLKKQGKLITDIEKMGKGVFPEKKTRAAEEPEIVELKEKRAALVKEAGKAGVEAKKLQKVEETSRDLEEQLEKQFRHIPPGKEKKKESPEIQAARKKAKDIQTQIDLVDQISDIQEQLRTGEIKVPEKKVKREDIVKVKALRNELNELRKQVYESGVETRQLETAMQTINELQDQLANHHRALKKKEVIPTQAVTRARKQVLGLRRQLFVEDALSDINEQFKTGEFKVPEPRKPRNLPPNLERTEVLLARKRKQLRQAINEMGPVTAGYILNEATGLPRALQSTADMSGWLRQNIIPVLSHPVKAARLVPSATKAFFSEYHAEKVQQDIENHPNFYLYDKSKLEIREIDGSVSKREESFQSRLAEKIPVLRQLGFGKVVRASNRNMVTIGNLIRTTLFDDYLAKNPNSTHEELSAYAQILNVTTGIGNLGPFANAGHVLGILGYAPKLAVSRFQTPWYLAKSRKYPRVFKQAQRDIGGFVATGATILGLFAMMADDDDDMEVSPNPRSPDFGKIRKGNTRFDIWGGYQQPARLISRIIFGVFDKTGLTGKFVPEEEEDINPMDLMWKFIQYKASPWISAGIQLYTGETVVGEKVTPLEVIPRTFVPLTLQDIYETAKKEGPKMAVLAGGAAWVGIGVNTYGDSYERVLQIERRRSRLEKEDKKIGREFKKKHRKILTFTNRSKRLDKQVKELEKERDEAKEKGRDKQADRKQKQIDRRIQAFELSFDRRMR